MSYTLTKYFCRGDSNQSQILRDRLYRSKSSPDCLTAMGGVAPDFPFSFVDVQKSRGPTIDRAAQHAQAQAHATQQAAYAREQDAYAAQQASYAAQQQQATTAPSSSYLAPEESTSVTDALPPGWMALQDPASGHYYYAHQTTGEVTWDRPQMAPQPAPAPQPLQQIAPTENGKQSRTTTLASKYGDGFVTSSSHPELASQYGNVGTRYV